MRTRIYSNGVLHWLRHYLRVQVLTIIVAILFIVTIPLPSMNHLHLTRPDRVSMVAQKQHVLSGTIHHQVFIRVPIIGQLPQLENGCEVTALAMLLQFDHIHVSNLTLAHQIARDKTPLVENNQGQIVSWGNPNDGFVGSITGKQPGFGVYHHPIAQLLTDYVKNKARDLTGIRFDALLAIIKSGRPTIVWTTTTLAPVHTFVTWESPTGPVHTTLDEHAVLLIGYTQTDVIINNPLSGSLQYIPIGPFRQSFVQMGRQAVTIAPLNAQNLR
ncbi:C39 family peptidase [Sulfoacidibacillus ferrooxidans]|uniref:Peptidase C39-like domain-containing protein n=1 Tax=Sulfoacidibacillus ferrooxidans TaxID=2005001 RepID=A0A9X1V9T9_9BACL|nr:hypothetical protein [Sulfoacidibacillus ferrooxidans]